MNDIRFEVGSSPWQPTSDSQLVDTFLYHNMPIVGVLQQRGRFYLFRCVEGFAASTQVWAYMEISPSALGYLRTLIRQTRGEMWKSLEAAITERIGSGPLTVALATDEDGVLAAIDLREIKGLSILDAEALLDYILRHGKSVAEKDKRVDLAVRDLQETILGT